MKEHYTSEEEYQAFLEFKRSRDLNLKSGDQVVVQRGDGTIDTEGWKIRYIYPNDEGINCALVYNEELGIKKDVPLSLLEEWQR